GDFLKRVSEAPLPDLIFYDPFSYKTDSELWGLRAFQLLYELCRARSTELFTYSGSTAVRATLLAAGFHVAKGAPTGPKAETTIALTGEISTGRELLGAEWLSRWERSDARLPRGA